MPAPDRTGVASLIDRYRSEQQEANAALAPLVEEQSLRSLRQELEELVTGMEGAAA